MLMPAERMFFLQISDALAEGPMLFTGDQVRSPRGMGANDVGRSYNVRVLSMRWLLRLLVVCFVVPAGYVAFTMVRAAVASELSAIDLFFGVSTLAAFVIGIWIVLDLSATVEDF